MGWFGSALEARSRRRERRFARRHGWFWLPCPLCGMEFGGHEWGTGDPSKPSAIALSSRRGKGICPSCQDAGLGDAGWYHPGGRERRLTNRRVD